MARKGTTNTMAHFDDPATQRANMRYIRNVMDEPLLERDHEIALAERWKNAGDRKALDALVRPHARLVVSIAAKFRHYGLPMGDLIQEGNIGLMEAAQRFEPERENRFSTYATWWIRAQIQDYVLRNWSIVRTGTTAAQKSLFFNLRRLRARIAGQNGRDYMDDAAVQSVARTLNVTHKEVTDMETRMNGGDQSLSAPVGEEQKLSWQDLMADTGPNPEDIVTAMKDGATLSRWLNEALSELSPRERHIVTERQMSEDGITLDELGKELGISKERVRQIEKHAMDKLKSALLGKEGLDRAALFV